ncbi:MAG: DUF5394 family protein [Alphaproteobacteria bacterium]|nr:DUF5394 family protein [Alphaproteobacteria bacterium]OJV13583.1 MAG: hypothetical protein BGO27_03090 [Alphaproteobacteria bacterium 33-17]
MSDNNRKDELFFAKVSEKFPDYDKAALTEIMEILNNSDSKEHENAIIIMIDKILQELSERGIDHGLSILNVQERVDLEQEINKIVNKLRQEGKNVEGEDVVKLLIGMIHKKFREKHEDLLKDDDRMLTKEQKRASKEHKKHLLEMAIYEFYKFIHPQAIAGETALENFINNMVIGGLQYAMKHEAKTQNIDKSFAKDMDNLHKDYHRQLDQHNTSKGGQGLGM